MTGATARAAMKTAVIIPAFNEKGKIAQTIASIPASCAQLVIVVDDGSIDSTAREAGEMGALVLRNGRQKGVGSAIRSGFHYALENGYDVVVVMAGNSKDDGREIPLLTEPVISGEFDLVQGSRYQRNSYGGDMPLYRIFATKIVHPALFSFFSGKHMTDSSNGFRAIRASLLRDARIHLGQPGLDAYELEIYLLFKAIRLHYRVTEVPVHKMYPDRKRGFTKMRPVIDWWKMVKPIFQLGLGMKT
ncbi:MAG: glycosyltransferase family 2 protein [Chitinispirillaceae bacterium]|nr:glycosyltransferase family 2 protein [Chitinispirillaceae bacterium]